MSSLRNRKQVYVGLYQPLNQHENVLLDDTSLKGIANLFWCDNLQLYLILIFAKKSFLICLTLICVGFLGVCFEVEGGGGGGKITPSV